jgi:predicted DNA-binding protein
MPKYPKKVQVLFSEEQFEELTELASARGKPVGTLVREAVQEYHLAKKKSREISEAADRILTFPPVSVPETWEELEEELSRLHGAGE